MRASSPGDDPRHIGDASVCWRLGDLASIALTQEHCLPGTAYLAWYGVSAAAKGRGYGRRVLRCALRWADRQHLAVSTYTCSTNGPSNRALMALGFEPYHPSEPWAGWEGITYWFRSAR
jgi:RimJ/RimL family protein N-acetyltransferase